MNGVVTYERWPCVNGVVILFQAFDKTSRKSNKETYLYADMQTCVLKIRNINYSILNTSLALIVTRWRR